MLFPAGAQSHKVVPKLEEDLASRLPFSFSHLVNKNTEAVLPSLPYEIGSTSNCAVSHHRSLSQDQRWLRWRVPTKPLDQKMLSYRSRTGLSFWSGQNNMQRKASSFFHLDLSCTRDSNAWTGKVLIGICLFHSFFTTSNIIVAQIAETTKCCTTFLEIQRAISIRSHKIRWTRKKLNNIAVSNKDP